MQVVNFIQDVATPHNNVLIKYLAMRSDVLVKVWYAHEEMADRYHWKNNITHQTGIATIYGNKLNPRFLWYCLTHKDEKYFIVGWMNINTILLHLFFFILQRKFNHWSDLPQPLKSPRLKARLRRYFSHFFLKYSVAKVFCVGKLTVDYFEERGFSRERLVNLPIFIETELEAEASSDVVTELMSYDQSYGLRNFIVSAGSRLLYEKGFDLLISACSELPKSLLARMVVYIVGNGPEKARLEQQTIDMKLENVVTFVDWMEFIDFQILISRSDVFVHPSRFDAYGGSIFAMAVGVPVIGSTGAGAVVDRVVDGENGLIFPSGDAHALADALIKISEISNFRSALALGARQTALEWKPEVGAEIIVANAI